MVKVKTAAEMIVKTIYFLVVVTASIILAFVETGQLTGINAAIAGIISVIVLALTLSWFLLTPISGKEDGKTREHEEHQE